jgi:hypothetical protein
VALFDNLFGGGGTGGFDVGRVEASLGYTHDDRNLKAWDRDVARARRDALKPVEQEIRTDYDRRGLDAYNSGSREAGRTSKFLSGAASKARGALMLVGKAALYAGGILGVGFVLGARKAVTAASDLNESVNAANAVFERAGPVMQKWSKTAADSFGLARSEALQAATGIGAMLKPMGFAPQEASKMSRAMVELAGDMASFNNEDPSEMLDRIRSGLAGESEPLRRFGVDLRVTAVEAFALKEGLIEQGEALEGAAFTQAAYQKILADTTDQQGDFARTSDGLANIQRRLRANAVDLAASFGKQLTPAVEAAAGKLNEFVIQMKDGTGAGGDFRRFLEGTIGDVKDFMAELGEIASDPSLSTEAKVSAIIGRLGEVAIDAFEAAVPAMAESAARAAPKVAWEFVKAFANADAWGKLALGAILLKSFGGFAGGAMLGRQMGKTTAAATAAGAAAGGATVGKGVTSMLKTAAKRAGIIGVGIQIADDLITGIQDTVDAKSDDILTSLAANNDYKAGLIGDIGGFLDPFDVLFKEGSDESKELEKSLRQIAEHGHDITKEREAEIRAMAATLDLTDEQKASMEAILKLGARRNRQEEQLRSLGADVEIDDPFKVGAISGFKANLRELRDGVYTTYKDIRRVSDQNKRTIADTVGEDTKAGRKLAAENMRATAEAIEKQMQRSGNVTKEGMGRVKRLIREADLVEGLRAREFGEGFAKMFDRAGKVTDEGLDKIVRQMKRMPEDARQTSYDAMRAQLRELQRGGDLSAEEVSDVRSRILSEFDDLKRKAPRTIFTMAQDLLGNFGNMGDSLGRGITTIRDNLNGALESLGVKALKFSVKSVGAGLAAGLQKRQQGGRGGFLPGTGREDTVLVAAAPDEAFLTGHQQQPVDMALAVTKRQGVQPYGSLDELFRGERRPHRTAQRFARGGWVDPEGPGTGVVNPAIAGVVGNWSQRYSAAINYGYDPGGGHLSPGHNVTGTATDTGPAAGWTSQATALFEQGLRAIEGKVPQILYGTAGIGDPWPNHGRGNHAHIEWGTNPSVSGLGGALAEHIAKVILTGPAGPLRDLGNAGLAELRSAANDYIDENSLTALGSHGSDVSGTGEPGFVGRIFASVAQRFKVARAKAGLALFEAGIVETGDPSLSTNPAGGDGTSRGALQLLDSTAAAYGLNPMDVQAVAAGFLTHGYTGKGGAMSLEDANPGWSAGNIAQAVQGSAYPERYDQAEAQARAVMQSLGLQRGGRAASALSALLGFQSGGKLRKRSQGLGSDVLNLEERIDLAERLFRRPGSVEGEDLSEIRDASGKIIGGETGELIGLNESLLAKMLKRRRVTEQLLRMATGRFKKADRALERRPSERKIEQETRKLENELTKLKPSEKNKRGAIRDRLQRLTEIGHNRTRLERERDQADRQREAQQGIMQELVGRTGKGGRIFDIRDELASLRGTPIDEPEIDNSAEQTRLTDIATLLREIRGGQQTVEAIGVAQLPILQSLGFQQGGKVLRDALAPLMPAFGGVYHNGGVVPGGPGEQRTIVASGGERFGGTGEPNIEVNVMPHPDGSAWVDVKIDGRLATRERKAGLGRQLPGAAGVVAARR